MLNFVHRHRKHIVGQLSGLDRVRFRGTLRRISSCNGLVSWLCHMGVKFCQFKDFAEEVTRRVIAGSVAVAEAAGRPVIHVRSPHVSKEEMAREIAERDSIEEGLVCMLSCVEPCMSFGIRRSWHTGRPEFICERRQCKHLYQYWIHPELGWMHARLQSWLPLSMWVCINGREWLARQMDQAGLGYQRRRNCFLTLEDAEGAQTLMNQQLEMNWPQLLESIAAPINPARVEVFNTYPLSYYWSGEETEWATDLLFDSTASLQRMYPQLINHAIRVFQSPDVMRFLGRRVQTRVPASFAGEVVSDRCERPEGVRIKHRMNANWIKMYDKEGSVLRIETTINQTRDFRVWRHAEGKPDDPADWKPLRKGVADLQRRAAISQRANERYLEALAATDTRATMAELVAPLCRPSTYRGRRVRALNPTAVDDERLLRAVVRGEFAVNGFRNRDLRQILYAAECSDPREEKRRSAAVSRRLRLLRAHGLITKIHKTHRYLTTARAQRAITALLHAHAAVPEALAAAAA